MAKGIYKKRLGGVCCRLIWIIPSPPGPHPFRRVMSAETGEPYPQPVLWIRIHMDPHPHQMKPRIRIKPDPDPHPDPHQSDNLDPEPDLPQFADDKPKSVGME